MKPTDEMRVLAFDVRHSRLGYALFEGPKQLIDWGVSTVPSRCSDRIGWIRIRAARLLLRCLPAFIVARYQSKCCTTCNSSAEPILKAILIEAEARGIPTQLVGPDEIKAAFQVSTKDEIATVLVRNFPELLVLLPARRAAWKSEPHRMIIFDAVATGFAHPQRPPPSE